jgi:hypothetical protein
MWFSSVIILVGKPNDDQNGLPDVLSAIRDTGASIAVVDEERSYIEATVLTRVIPIISSMEGVSYVRQVFSYHCAEPEAPVDEDTRAKSPVKAA